ncbi:SIR2 family NAD-dependent protein deacylase [Sorangium sp. So ce381]|uniref:SIR2 family NAD-dependent protein deacylase n=1 Tax=Sorangium sp. So ce381 TaxID=3133307 RepID=UPI003F5C0FAB
MTIKVDQLPDRVHIEALRDALWRPVSRASVLVGAGVSRNAVKISPGVRAFPLWPETAAELKRALDPKAWGNDPLRLGQTYQNTYGRARLDDLLLDLIPDRKYEPGALHMRLLRLPWSDVFTTNYDTLLERTRNKVPERNYDVIETPQDLTRAERPRIVKLHGSFPATRPFVFTAEDYRRYPVDFAPFINLVRQSAMENVLCLIGFSGDDPNFVQWAGWVRDQLGSTAPKMYLCGVLDLTTPDRNYYQHMQVNPIDLGPLFPEHDFAASERHSIALAWLIESLHSGEPVDLGKWPRPKSHSRTVLPLPTWQPPLPSPAAPPITAPPKQIEGEMDMKTLEALLKSWHSRRICYPGWPVCPGNALSSLLQDTLHWMWHFERPAGVRLLEAMDPVARAIALREIAWCATTCLVPLPNTLPLLIEKVLQAINPRPRLIDNRDADITPASVSASVLGHLTEVWVDLAFSMVRHAWQFQDFALHERWHTLMRYIAESRPDWHARWWHAKCWYHIVRLEAAEALKAARAWPQDVSIPFWHAKHGMVLGELGQLTEAREMVTQALERVRQGRDLAQIDYRSLSEEGWILILEQVLDNYAWEALKFGHELRERRFRELTRDQCNPWDDLQDRSNAIRDNEFGNQLVRSRGFDPGSQRESFSWSSRSSQIDAWVLICTLSDGLRPIRKSKGLIAAVRCLWSASPRLCLSLAIVSNASDELRENESLGSMVGRASMLHLKQDQFCVIFDWLTFVLRDALSEWEDSRRMNRPDLKSDGRRIKGAAELLSRLTVRLDSAQLANLFELACEMYLSSACQRSISLHQPLANLFRRVIFASQPEQLVKWLPRLLALPVVGEPGFEVEHAPVWPDPFSGMYWLDTSHASAAEMNACGSAIARLLDLVRIGETEARCRSSWRLAALALAGVLAPTQIEELTAAIWSRTDVDGYPVGIGFAPWVLIKLFDPPPGRARQAIVDHLRNTEHEPDEWIALLDSAVAPLAASIHDYVRVPGVAWTSEEASEWLDRFILMWKNPDLDRWRKSSTGLPHRVGHVLSTAIAPFLDLAHSNVQSRLMVFIDMLSLRDEQMAAVCPLIILLDATKRDAVASDIYRAIVNEKSEVVKGGIDALVVWYDLSLSNRIDEPPSWLIDLAVACIETNRRPGLEHVLSGFALLLQRKRFVLESRHFPQFERGLDRVRESSTVMDLEDRASNDDLQIDGDERVAITAEASMLAAALAGVCLRRGVIEPAAVAAWRAFAAVHPLPEVRRPWWQIDVLFPVDREGSPQVE